jgi:hypothetical protein
MSPPWARTMTQLVYAEGPEFAAVIGPPAVGAERARRVASIEAGRHLLIANGRRRQLGIVVVPGMRKNGIVSGESSRARLSYCSGDDAPENARRLTRSTTRCRTAGEYEYTQIRFNDVAADELAR